MTDPAAPDGQTPQRLAIIAAAGLFPLAVVGVLFYGIADRFPVTLPDDLQTVTFQTSGAALAPAMLKAANVFLLSAALLIVTSVALIAWTCIGFARTFGVPVALGLGAAALVLGGWHATTPDNALVGLLVDDVHRQAVKAKVWDVLAYRSVIADTKTLALAFGMAAVLSTVARLMMLARALPPTDTPEQAFAERAAALRATLIGAGLLLTLTTSVTYFFYHTPIAMMVQAQQDTFDLLTAQASLRWGGAYTVVLICTAMPPLAAFLNDRAVFARARQCQAPPLFPGDTLSANTRRIAAAIAVIAPASIVPIFEALKTLSS